MSNFKTSKVFGINPDPNAPTPEWIKVWLEGLSDKDKSKFRTWRSRANERLLKQYPESERTEKLFAMLDDLAVQDAHQRYMANLKKSERSESDDSAATPVMPTVAGESIQSDAGFGEKSPATPVMPTVAEELGSPIKASTMQVGVTIGQQDAATPVMTAVAEKIEQSDAGLVEKSSATPVMTTVAEKVGRSDAGLMEKSSATPVMTTVAESDVIDQRQVIKANGTDNVIPFPRIVPQTFGVSTSVLHDKVATEVKSSATPVMDTVAAEPVRSDTGLVEKSPATPVIAAVAETQRVNYVLRTPGQKWTMDSGLVDPTTVDVTPQKPKESASIILSGLHTLMNAGKGKLNIYSFARLMIYCAIISASRQSFDEFFQTYDLIGSTLMNSVFALLTAIVLDWIAMKQFGRTIETCCAKGKLWFERALWHCIPVALIIGGNVWLTHSYFELKSNVQANAKTQAKYDSDLAEARKAKEKAAAEAAQAEGVFYSKKWRGAANPMDCELGKVDCKGPYTGPAQADQAIHIAKQRQLQTAETELTKLEAQKPVASVESTGADLRQKLAIYAMLWAGIILSYLYEPRRKTVA